MTIDNLFDQYIELKASSISAQTLRTNVGFYHNHIQPIFGSRHIETIQYIEYQKFSNNLLLTFKPKTVKNILLVLTAIYKFARKIGVYKGDNVVSFVELPKFDNRRYFTLDAELQKQYIRAILSFDEPIYKDIFLFLLHGRRLSEVLSLTWQRLDLNEGVLYLPHTHNKAKKNLSFQLTSKLVESLRVLASVAVDRQNTPFISGYVFLNPDTLNRFYDVRKPWVRLLKRANLPHIRIHDIRHLITTYCVNELDMSITKISHALGHTDIQTTLGYLNPKPHNSKEVINSLFDSVVPKPDPVVAELQKDINISKRVQDLMQAINS